MLGETRSALEILLKVAKNEIPPECIPIVNGVQFTSENIGTPDFPCPFKETEATGALKAVEAGVASAIAGLALGEKERSAVVDLERASCFLFSTYLATVGGFDKANPEAKTLLKGILDPKVIALLTDYCRHRSQSRSVEWIPSFISKLI